MGRKRPGLEGQSTSRGGQAEGADSQGAMTRQAERAANQLVWASSSLDSHVLPRYCCCCAACMQDEQ